MSEPAKPTAIHYAFVASVLLCMVCAVGWLQAWQGMDALTNEKRRLVEGAQTAYAPKVSSEDLNSGGAIVIGRLGVPLLKMVTLRGTWKYPDQSRGPTKDYSLYLHVTEAFWASVWSTASQGSARTRRSRAATKLE